MEGFDAGRYVGVWYEYSNTWEVFQVSARCLQLNILILRLQIGGTCARVRYTQVEGGIGVTNEQVNTITGGYASVTGTAVPTNISSELIVNFEGVPCKSLLYLIQNIFNSNIAQLFLLHFK